MLKKMKIVKSSAFKKNLSTKIRFLTAQSTLRFTIVITLEILELMKQIRVQKNI